MLSRISRGTTHDKLSFIFKLYDQNCDDYITKHEMLTITQAVYDMLGEQSNFGYRSSNGVLVTIRN